MKKSIFNIKLIDGLVFGSGNAKNSANSSRLDNRAESLIIVKVRLLRKSLSNKTTFVTIKFFIIVKLVAI